jgi:NADPH2:quinone reductase
VKAIVYRETGGPEVLTLENLPEPEPGPGEVRVRISFSGVNPTDWKSRRGEAPGRQLPFEFVVPNQDGSGVIDRVGPGVDADRIGENVWLWDTAWQRPYGTAEEYVTVPEVQAVRLPPGIGLDVGACIGIPYRTAHRCLTVAEDGPDRLRPGALAGRTVLIAGGAGAVGNAAIQLARWAGAQVVTTVSSPEKAGLARAAGAHHVVNYRSEDAEQAIRLGARNGVDIIVEVAAAQNVGLDTAVIAPYGVIAVYANNGGNEVSVPIRPMMTPNARWQFVLVYTEPEGAKMLAIDSVTEALADQAIRIGSDAGLPVHHFPLRRAAEAHAAVESGIAGKVLIDL